MSIVAPLKVDTLKANKQPHDKLLRHLSLGAQSSPPAATQDDSRRSLRQLIKRSWTKALALPKH